MPRIVNHPEPVPEEQRLMGRDQTSQRLGVSPSTVDRLRRTGTLPCVRIGSRVLFDPDAVNALVASGRPYLSTKDQG